MTLKVNRFNLVEEHKNIPQQQNLKKLAFLVLQTEKIISSVNLIFCGDSFIQHLNQSFRGFDKPTDVLSFPYKEKHLWGEIYISLETAQRQANEVKCSLFYELQKLVVHGCLHLSGWDHQTDKEEIAMKHRENKFLQIFS